MKKAVLILIALGCASSQAAPSSFAPTGTITYEAVGPLGKWKGINKAIQGKLSFDRASKELSGSICVLTKAWNSNEATRDEHTRNMFEVEKFPNACFAPSSLEGSVGGKVQIEGKLTMHGVTLPVVLNGTAKDDGTKLYFTGGFDTKVTIWGMERPNILGFTVADEIPVTISAEAVEK